MAVQKVLLVQKSISSIRVENRHRQDLGDIQGLADNIKQVGALLQPIVINSKGKLLAGERRLEALKLLGKKSAPVRVLDLENATLAEFSENAFRKDFTMSEKIAIGEELEAIEKRKAKVRQLAGVKAKESEKGQSRDRAAKMMGISPKHYERGKAVVRIARAFPKSKEAQEALALLDQKKGVSKAFTLAKRVERVASIKPVKLNSKMVELHTKDFRKVDWRANSIDLVYCDPPWKDVALYEDVARVAALTLKEDGFCMVYIGTSFLPKVLELMSKHLTFVWQLVINYDGSYSTMVQCGLMRRYTSVLVFSKNKTAQHHYEDRLRGFDSYTVEGKTERDYHKWQQALSPAVYYIESCTKEGDTVADFCLGSGTFGVAAHQLGRRFIGCDPDGSCIKIARHRIATEKRAASCRMTA